MINRIIEQYELKQAVSGEDEYGQKIKASYSTIKTIPVSVVFTAESELANNPKYQTVSYIGIIPFWDETIGKTDRLDNKYQVVATPIHAGRKTLLLLEDL